MAGDIAVSYKSETESISNPFRILGIVFIAFNNFHPFGIGNNDIDIIFKKIEYENPVFTNGFHVHTIAMIVEKPSPELPYN